jgi:hypothetical protein
MHPLGDDHDGKSVLLICHTHINITGMIQVYMLARDTFGPSDSIVGTHPKGDFFCHKGMLRVWK